MSPRSVVVSEIGTQSSLRCLALRITQWSRQSLRIEPISRSAYGFCQGLRGAVSTSSICSDASANELRCRRCGLDLGGDTGADSDWRKASTICWDVQGGEGCSVTLKC